jgi:sulfotransferase family protein
MTDTPATQPQGPARDQAPGAGHAGDRPAGEPPAHQGAGRERPVRDEFGRLVDTPPILFVGGTGRSGTHVVARLLARHPRLAIVPVEVRFHVEEDGFPGLLAERVTKQQFVRRLRGFWWKGFQTRRMRGLYRFVPTDRFESAVAGFETSFDADPAGACRRLFYELLWERAEQAGAYGIVEQSCDTVAQAPTLARLFPEAKFLHVVRDGRDASASRVAQTKGLIYPRTRRQGLEWWAERIRRIDAGARAIPADRVLTMSLDEVLLLGHRRALKPICQFAGIYRQKRMKRFFNHWMSSELARSGRWRAGLGERRATRLDHLYGEILDDFEDEGVRCAPLLRRTLERSQAPTGTHVRPQAFVAGDGTPLAART